MILHNAFSIPLAPEEAWRLLVDVRRISNCVPGGELTEIIDAQTFKGRMRVRLGPVLVEFGGTAQFESLDETAASAALRAIGNDTKGRGSATARSRFVLEPDRDGSAVSIETDLQLVGMIAQYGRARGVMAALSQQLVDEFAVNLRDEIMREHAERAAAGMAEPVGDGGATGVRQLAGFGFFRRAVLAAIKRRLARWRA